MFHHQSRGKVRFKHGKKGILFTGKVFKKKGHNRLKLPGKRREKNNSHAVTGGGRFETVRKTTNNEHRRDQGKLITVNVKLFIGKKNNTE